MKELTANKSILQFPFQRVWCRGREGKSSRMPGMEAVINAWVKELDDPEIGNAKQDDDVELQNYSGIEGWSVHQRSLGKAVGPEHKSHRESDLSFDEGL